MPVDWHPQLKGERLRMRHVAIAVILACMLSGTARAGEIPSTGVLAPPPPPCTLAAKGEIPCGDRSGEIPTSDATVPEASTTVLTIILTLINIGR